MQQEWAVEQLACFACEQAEEITSTRELMNREAAASNALRKLTGRDLRVEIRVSRMSWDSTKTISRLHIFERTAGARDDVPADCGEEFDDDDE